MKTPLYRTLHPEIKIVDASKGVLDFVASDETIDYYNEIVRAAGWRFNNFARNSPVPDSHDYSSIDKLLGKVTDWWIKDRKLIERVQLAIDVAEQPLARLAWRMIEAGYLKACSVGFMPTRMVGKWDDSTAWADAVKLLGLSAEAAAKVRVIYLEQEQMELSICILGANPSALAKAYRAGAIKDEDIDLIGTISEGNHNRKTAARATKPDHARAATRSGRAEFLRSLKAQITQ